MPELRRPPSASRIVDDFVRPGRGQLIVGVILLLCGLMVTMQLQTRGRADAYSTLRRTDLVAMLDGLTAESRNLEGEIAALEETRRQLQSGADAQAVAEADARKRLDALELLAGTVAARGPGVRIVIGDPQGKVTPEILMNAVNELRDAGAEVIEINDKVRVVATSWAARGASGLVVDGQAVDRPLIIEAIGEAETLSEAAKFRGGLVSQVESSQVGGTVTVTTLPEVQVNAIRVPQENQFARPA